MGKGWGRTGEGLEKVGEGRRDGEQVEIEAMEIEGLQTDWKAWGSDGEGLISLQLRL